MTFQRRIEETEASSVSENGVVDGQDTNNVDLDEDTKENVDAESNDKDNSEENNAEGDSSEESNGDEDNGEEDNGEGDDDEEDGDDDEEEEDENEDIDDNSEDKDENEVDKGENTNGDDEVLEILEEELEELEDAFGSITDDDYLNDTTNTEPFVSDDALDMPEVSNTVWVPTDDSVVNNIPTIQTNESKQFNNGHWHYLVAAVLVVFGIGLVTKFMGRNPTKRHRHNEHKRLPMVYDDEM
jgi:hypothetical protein